MATVEVLLRGLLLARYRYEIALEADDSLLIERARQDVLRERLVDEPHLSELSFEVRRT